MNRHLPLLIIFLLSFSSSKAQWTSRHNMNAAEYQTFANECTSQGMRPISISGYTVFGQERYAALYEKTNSPAWVTKHSMSAAEFQNQFNTLGPQGYQLTFISGYAVNGQPKFAAIWEKKNEAYIAKSGQTAAQSQAEFNTNTANGYRCTFLTCYSVNNIAYYASIYTKTPGPAYMALAAMTAADYQQKFTTYTSQGYRIKMVNGCNVNGTDYYTAIWEKTNGPEFWSKNGIPGNNFQNNFDNFYYQGYKPSFMSAFTSSNTERFNGIWENTNMAYSDIKKIDDAVNSYMSSQNVKALSLAVSKNDRLVFAKGYGSANTGTGQDLSPNYSMRIMSISKPMTSAGIMMLVKKGSLNLDQKVFGPNSILGNMYPYPNYNKANLELITVRSLLHHTSGLRTCDGEAPFWNANSSYADCMNVLLNANDLFAFPPNTKFNYSNTGFFILARIIEKVSNLPYETFMRNNVLTPSGVGSTMHIGAANGAPGTGEVSTYTPMTNINQKMCDGFGGWVARPIDLLKVLARFDGLTQKPDLISAALYDTLTTSTPISNGYALGWLADKTTYQTHNGCFGGTRSFLYYDIPSGLSFAVIINNDPMNDDCGWTMKQVILDAIKKVGVWPGYDLF